MFLYILRSAYSKTCLKRPIKKKTKNLFSRLIIAKCRSKVLQNAPREQSAILSTFIKLPSLRSLFCLFLSGRLRQVLLYCASAYVTVAGDLVNISPFEMAQNLTKTTSDIVSSCYQVNLAIDIPNVTENNTNSMKRFF